MSNKSHSIYFFGTFRIVFLVCAGLRAAFTDTISSGQRNLMKTYHNEANTAGITKIGLKNFVDFFGHSR